MYRKTGKYFVLAYTKWRRPRMPLCNYQVLSVCLSVSLLLSNYLSIYLYISIYISLSICLSICLPIYLSIYLLSLLSPFLRAFSNTHVLIHSLTLQYSLSINHQSVYLPIYNIYLTIIATEEISGSWSQCIGLQFFHGQTSHSFEVHRPICVRGTRFTG